MLVNREEEKRGGIAVQIGKVGTLKRRVGRKLGRFGKIEAERKLSLEPRFDSVAVA